MKKIIEFFKNLFKKSPKPVENNKVNRYSSGGGVYDSNGKPVTSGGR